MNTPPIIECRHKHNANRQTDKDAGTITTQSVTEYTHSIRAHTDRRSPRRASEGVGVRHSRHRERERERAKAKGR